jgi:hypothetical protein
MRATLRTLVIAATAIALLGVGAASASAVTIQNNGVTCGSLSGGPAGSGNPFTGGCDVTAHSDSSILTVPGQPPLDCAVDITDAQVSGAGAIGINAVDVFPGTDANCDLVEPCLDPELPWDGSVGGGSGAFTATIVFCVDTPLGTFSGPTTGELRNASGSTPPQIEFDNAAIGSTTATLDGVYDLDPATLSVS